MHIKRMHEMIEKLTECALSEMDCGIDKVNTEEMGEVIDMIKDLAEAEYKARISKAMEKAEEEEEAEEKYMLCMLKDEYKDEYKHYCDVYGEEEADRRFYDSWRHADGTFARKGTGEYRPRSYYRRRGYVEPPYYHMMPEYRMSIDEYKSHTPEYYRDVDRSQGRLYFSTPITSEMRDKREGKAGEMRRGYMEAKEIHADNTPESKQAKMHELEKYMRSLSDDLTEAIDGASNEEKTMLKTKLQTLIQKIN